MKSSNAIRVQQSIRFLLGVLFIYASLSKWIDLQLFQEGLLNSPVFQQFSSSFVKALTWVVPGTEGILGVFLITKSQHLKLILKASLVLLSSYTTYLIYISWFADQQPCSCTGIIRGAGWATHFWVTLSFGVLNLIALSFFKGITTSAKKNISAR